VFVCVFAAKPSNKVTVVEIIADESHRCMPCTIMGETFFDSGTLMDLEKQLDGNKCSRSLQLCIQDENRHLVRQIEALCWSKEIPSQMKNKVNQRSCMTDL
jgi:hypothetical protein